MSSPRAGGAEFVSPALQRGETRFHHPATESRGDGARTFLLQESIDPEDSSNFKLSTTEKRTGCRYISFWMSQFHLLCYSHTKLTYTRAFWKSGAFWML